MICSNKMLLQSLKSTFSKTWNMLTNYYEEYGTYKDFRTAPEDKEYIIIYATPLKGTLVFDCLSREVYSKEKMFLSSVSELDFENITDEKASMVTTTGIKKIRRLSKS